MGLIQKLTEDELALLEITEDPVWLTEFLYNTANGETNSELWPKDREFKLRSYQRDLMTDRSKWISLTGGRAIGKCNLSTTRVYTDEGYRTINQLLKVPSFNCYCLDENGEIALKRGKAYPDKRVYVFRVETESNKVTHCTANHPFLTREGWKKLKHLKIGDEIAVATSLPPLNHNNNTFAWHELRWLGYMLLANKGVEGEIKLRFRKQVAELRLIAKKFNLDLIETDRTIALKQKQNKGFLVNTTTWFMREIGFDLLNINGIAKIPDLIMRLPNDALKILIESLFSQWADLNTTSVALASKRYGVLRCIQEILMRFGIESRIEDKNTLYLQDSAAIYKFYTTFDLPGVKVENIPLPPPDYRDKEHVRFESIISIIDLKDRYTYAIYVYDYHNFIGDDIYQHNTLVLESKIVYNVVNAELEYPVTREQLFATANQSQLNPVFNRLITRFTTGKFLKSFLNNRINKTQGILEFPSSGLLFNARIAGSKGENNMIGLHLPKMIFDESQVFPLASFTQAMPALNSWEPRTQVMLAGVPNCLRNSVLYMADQKWSKYKKYRIPSHNNPFYSRQDDIDNIKKSGGENSDEYQNLVLGRHGSAAVQILSSESIKRQSYDFYSYRYSSNNKIKGEEYQQIFNRPQLPEGLEKVYLSCDFGYIDPSVLNIWGLDKKGTWRNYARYRIQRIDYHVQEKIIDWLDDEYHFDLIGLDLGAGGSGAAMMQGLAGREDYKHKGYSKRTYGINFGESMIIGRDDDKGTDIKKDVKSLGTEELVRKIEDGIIVFSELDAEGTSELEKIAKTVGINGVPKYFIMSDNGRSKSGSDHHYASALVFAMMIREYQTKKRKKLGRSFSS